MALTEQQRALVAAILERDDTVPDWDWPWDVDRSRDLTYGGYPLKVTGGRWEWRNANHLRIKASNLEFDRPTWLTAEEIKARGARSNPWARPVEVEIQGRTTLAYNVAEIRGLPERLYRPFWEIHPVNPDHRHPGFDQYVRSLDVEIRPSVEWADGRTEAEYLDQHNVIVMPPFELFFSAHDYYRTLSHELIHWAAANTNLVETILFSETADYARHELVSEFGTAFLIAEQGLSDVPHRRNVAYVRHWRDKGSLSDAEVIHAAEDAARVAAWLCHEAPAWRVPRGESYRQTPTANQGTRHPAPRRHHRTDVSHLEAAAAARRFVADVHALERSAGDQDRDAWDREAARLLKTAATIDLAIPAVAVAIEAAVAIETPADTPPLSAAAWLDAFRERTTRIRTMRAMTKNADNVSASASRGPRFT